MLIEIERCRLITLCQPTQRASACELARLSSLDVLFGRECTNLVSGNKIYVSKDPEFEFNYDFGCPRSFERHYSLFGFLRAANKLRHQSPGWVSKQIKWRGTRSEHKVMNMLVLLRVLVTTE